MSLLRSLLRKFLPKTRAISTSEDLTQRILRQYGRNGQRSVDAGAFLRVSRDFHYTCTGVTVFVFDSLSLLASMQHLRSTGLQLDCDPRLHSMMTKLREGWMGKDAFIK